MKFDDFIEINAPKIYAAYLSNNDFLFNFKGEQTRAGNNWVSALMGKSVQEATDLYYHIKSY